MSEWEDYKLSDVIELIGGGTPKTTVAEYWGGDIPWLSVVDFNTGNKYVEKTEKTITPKGLKNSSTKMLNVNEIIISARGTVGAMAVLKKPMAFNQSCYGIRCIPNKSHQDYLYYLIKDAISNLQQIAHGGVFDTITRETFSAINILLPPAPEQKAIASVLSSLDDKIDLLHRQNKTLEAMAETLFRQWFVEEAEISLVQLGNIIEVFDSKRIPLSSMQRANMKEGRLYPYYGAATIMDYINQYIFDGEYLLLGEDGTVQTDEGFPVLQLATGQFWVNNHTHVLRAKKPFTNFLLYTILKRTSISHIVTGAVQPKINQENLKSLELEIANENQIAVTAESTEVLWHKIQHNKFQIGALEKLRDTLLPKLMSGEVRVAV
jgi:type I restriction enzyme S subunit